MRTIREAQLFAWNGAHGAPYIAFITTSSGRGQRWINMSNFVAIDFETANHSRTSACAVGLVHVQDGKIIAEETLLIRPPQRQFVFTYIHGLTWDDVKDEPT